MEDTNAGNMGVGPDKPAGSEQKPQAVLPPGMVMVAPNLMVDIRESQKLFNDLAHKAKEHLLLVNLAVIAGWVALAGNEKYLTHWVLIASLAGLVVSYATLYIPKEMVRRIMGGDVPGFTLYGIIDSWLDKLANLLSIVAIALFLYGVWLLPR